MANTDLVGANGSITWMAGLTNITGPAATRAHIVQANIYRNKSNTTRPNSLMERFCMGPYTGTVTIRVFVTDDLTPPVPILTVGTLKIGLDSASPAQHYVFKVQVQSMGNIGYTSIDGHRAQTIDYGCVLCSNATTDTVVAT